MGKAGRFLSAAAIGLVLVAGGAVVLSAIWDPENAAPGSLAYSLGIPSGIKELPVPSPCGEPRYAYIGPDGEKTSIARLTFETRLSAAEIDAQYRRLAAGAQCRTSEGEEIFWANECGTTLPVDNLRLQIDTTRLVAGCLPVTVTSLGE